MSATSYYEPKEPQLIIVEEKEQLLSYQETVKFLGGFVEQVKLNTGDVLLVKNTITIQNEMSDAEIGIIIACTGGIIVIAFIFVLGMLCYKRHRYGAIYLSKSSIGKSLNFFLP